MRGDAERAAGVGWGGGAVGGGIVTSYRRAHMQKLPAFTAFLMSLRGRKHVPPLPSASYALDSSALTFKGT